VLAVLIGERVGGTAEVGEVVPGERANGALIGGDTLMQGMIAGPLAGFLFVLAASVRPVASSDRSSATGSSAG
jgi:hypothetical protein